MCVRKPGEAVQAGEPVLELHAADPGRFDAALRALEGAIEVAPEAPEPAPLVLDRMGP